MPEEVEPQSIHDSLAERQAFMRSVGTSDAEVDAAANAPAEVDDATLETQALEELTAPPTLEGAPPATTTTTQPAPTLPQGAPSWVANDPAALEAWQVTQALRTETGVRTMVSQGLEALGYTREQIQAFVDASKPTIAGTPAPAVAPPVAAPVAEAPDALAALAELDDGELVDGATLKKLLTSAVSQIQQQAIAAAQAQVAPVQQAAEAQQQAVVQNVADATYQEVLGEAPADPAAYQAWMLQVNEIQGIAQQLLGDYPATPANIRAVILQGHQAFLQRQEQVFRAYIQQKKQTAAAQPTNIGGGTVPTDGPVTEPKSLAESRKAMREAFPSEFARN